MTRVLFNRIDPDEASIGVTPAEALALSEQCAEESRRLLNEQATMREGAGGSFEPGLASQASTLAQLSQAYAMIACGRLA